MSVTFHYLSGILNFLFTLECQAGEAFITTFQTSFRDTG